MADSSDAPPSSPEQAQQYAAEATDLATSRRGIGQLARLGYFAIGVVYALMGVLAGMGLAGLSAGQYTGSFGAIRLLASQPYGRLLLSIIAAGLAVYVCWRLAQSVFNIEDRGTSTGGLLRRGGLLLSALAYAFLTVRVVFGIALGGQGTGSKASWSKRLMNQPAGLVLVGLVGLVILGVAAVQFRSAYRAGFLEQIDASGGSRRWISVLGRVGFFARGVVFGIIGFFLVISAIQTAPGEAKGLGGAIQTLGRQPYGRFLIGVVALGLFCYGLFMLAKARFRRLAPGTPGEENEEA